jgi:hypothetical protein
MAVDVLLCLTPEEVERRLRAVDPAVLLLPPRVLKRVIKRDRGLVTLGLRVPHRKSYVLSRTRLLDALDPADRPPALATLEAEWVVLLPRPDPDRLARQRPGDVLLDYWRLLFHCHVHLAIDRRRAEGRLDDAGVRDRIDRLGPTAFAEARAVLAQERFLLPPAGPAAAYAEFAAVYLEQRHFTDHLLPNFFPGLDRARADAVLADDIDAAALLARTRPEGAAEPPRVPPSSSVLAALEPVGEGGPGPDAEAPEASSDRRYNRCMARADAVAARGNDVRAAVLRMRAARVARNCSQATASRRRAAADLGRLAERLKAALRLDDSQAEDWRQALQPLLEPAARGYWPAAARLLYDLQKVCLDHERDIYAVDVVEWVVSLGRKPVRRLLPLQREVRAVRHLRRALGRLGRVRTSGEDRRRLSLLLHAALPRAEHRLRQRVQPRLEEGLDAVNLRGGDHVERLGRRRLVEELLDRVTERGFLTMSDLRDGLARSPLKMPDLSSPGEFFSGDRLIRANRQLAIGLDGVYRRGEIYLRWLQRFSSLTFGTRVGRFLTRYLVLPFGGAFVLLKGFEEISEKLTQADLFDVTPGMVGVMGVFLFLLLYWPAFRRQVGRGARGLFLVLRALLVDAPVYLWSRPWVRWVVESRPVRLLRRYAVRPLLAGAVVGGLARLLGAGPEAAGRATAAGLVAGAFLFNSRLGRLIEEAVTDQLAYSWERLSRDFLPGLFRAVMEFFRRALEALERLIYTVDEKLRFRTGESRPTVFAKGVLNLGWFVVAYVVTFAVVVLIEPQINPIKHFPVVTVSHKMLLPLVPHFGHVLAHQFNLHHARAFGLAFGIIFCIPGIFGFLVWELKENWRLYAANRPKALKPAVIGRHGETLPRFFRPGFHSGTVPKLFARLRKAERRHNAVALHRRYEALHHVEEELRHFFEREFVWLLTTSRGWGGVPVSVGELELATNRLRVELATPTFAGPSAWLGFEERAGWLLAGFDVPGWVPSLTADQRAVLRTALVGLYKRGGVALVREELAARLGGRPFDLGPEGLTVLPGPAGEPPALVDLDDPTPAPADATATPDGLVPPWTAAAVRFDRRPVLWSDWVEVWEQDQDGKPPRPLVEGVRLLPG